MRLKTLVEILATFDPEMSAILVCSGSTVIVFEVKDNMFNFVKLVDLDNGLIDQPLPSLKE